MILYPFIYLHIYLNRLCRCRCRCLRPLSLPLPHFLLDGRLPIVNPISKARNATMLLQASAAATAARDKFQCDRLSRYCDHWNRQRQPGSTMEPVGRANLPRLRAPLGRGTQRAAAATPQRAATAANQWADEGPTPADFSERAWGTRPS